MKLCYDYYIVLKSLYTFQFMSNITKTYRFGRWGCRGGWGLGGVILPTTSIVLLSMSLSIGLSRTIMGFYTIEWLGQIFMLKDNVCRVEAKILDKSRQKLVRIWTGEGTMLREKKGHGMLVVECKYSITLTVKFLLLRSFSTLSLLNWRDGM